MVASKLSNQIIYCHGKIKHLWDHAQELDVRVDLEGAVAAPDGMKSEAVSTGR
jgi:hypothetical protein